MRIRYFRSNRRVNECTLEHLVAETGVAWGCVTADVIDEPLPAQQLLAAQRERIPVEARQTAARREQLAKLFSSRPPIHYKTAARREQLAELFRSGQPPPEFLRERLAPSG